MFGAIFGVWAAFLGLLILIFGTALNWWQVILADIAIVPCVALLLLPLALLTSSSVLSSEEEERIARRRFIRLRREWRSTGEPNEHELLRGLSWPDLATLAYSRIRRRGIRLALGIPAAFATGWLTSNTTFTTCLRPRR